MRQAETARNTGQGETGRADASGVESGNYRNRNGIDEKLPGDYNRVMDIIPIFAG